MPREAKGTERRSGRRGLTTAPAALVERYTYRVAWSEEDQEFVGLCAEFPSLSWLDRSQADALAGIVRLVRGVMTDMSRQGTDPRSHGTAAVSGLVPCAHPATPPSAARGRGGRSQSVAEPARQRETGAIVDGLLTER